jgi:galactokinase
MGAITSGFQEGVWTVPRLCIKKSRQSQFNRRGTVTCAKCEVKLIFLCQHIDYSLYEVLPMAVTVDILLAVKVTKTEGASSITIANVNDKFPKREFQVPANGDIEIDSSSLQWSNYFKAGLKGAASLLVKKHGSYTPVNMEILADGTVPAGGGLSSSAAFVCASALAVLKACGEEVINKKELTELAIVCERSVGVNSGGYVSPVEGDTKVS